MHLSDCFEKTIIANFNLLNLTPFIKVIYLFTNLLKLTPEFLTLLKRMGTNLKDLFTSQQQQVIGSLVIQ